MTKIETVRKFYEIFASAETSKFSEILTANWDKRPQLTGRPKIENGEAETVEYLHSLLSEISYDVDDIYQASESVVVCRNMLRGTIKDQFLGLRRPGERIELMTMEFHHFDGDRIALTWHLEDFFGVYQKLLAKGDDAMPKSHEGVKG
jgi:predicted ester cyclase